MYDSNTDGCGRGRYAINRRYWHYINLLVQQRVLSDGCHTDDMPDQQHVVCRRPHVHRRQHHHGQRCLWHWR